MRTIKNNTKHNKTNKTNKNNKAGKKTNKAGKKTNKTHKTINISGGSPFNIVSTFVKTSNKDYKTSIASVPIIGQIAKTTQQLDPKLLMQSLQPTKQDNQIIFNRSSPNKIQIKMGQNNITLLETQIENEPHIRTNSMERFLVVMYDASKGRMIWIAEFKTHSKYKTILSYQLPKILPNQERNIIIQFIPYPETTKPFTLPDMSITKRKKVFKMFMTYAKENNINFINNQLKGKALFKIKADPNKGINLFNLSKTMMKTKIK